MKKPQYRLLTFVTLFAAPILSMEILWRKNRKPLNSTIFHPGRQNMNRTLLMLFLNELKGMGIGVLNENPLPERVFVYLCTGLDISRTTS